MPLQKLSNDKIQLTGSLNFATVPALRRQFVEYLPLSSNVIVDLAVVEKCDSSGVSLLLEFLRLSEAAQKNIQFINIPAQLQAVMHAAAVTEILPI